MTAPKLGRLYVDGKPFGEDKIFPLQQIVKKHLIAQGIKPERIAIHYPVYPGIAKCTKCFQMTFKPALKVYDGNEYWICKCKAINYIK